ncbi:hypothetical protein GTG28_04965 [Vibrio sp. OCN044]|uniref:Uncharacterized protein n=1 Tax=Vibrio tetraodonis subsp. pristinus TaxID=2695891 RepID=A0A6L8LZ62_9VIBR|nr:hypothetical protein [Vibrio tetraodonis]MYM58569.1 hypothetical protein [Vibrio tetraodonis subsp. pristinus]
MNYLLGLFVLILSASVQSAPENIAQNKTITKISTYHTEAVIYYSPIVTNSQNCTDTRNNAFKIDLSSDSGKQLLSTALTAAAAQKEVGFGIDGCLGGNLPKVYRIDVVF